MTVDMTVRLLMAFAWAAILVMEACTLPARLRFMADGRGCAKWLGFGYEAVESDEAGRRVWPAAFLLWLLVHLLFAAVFAVGFGDLRAVSLMGLFMLPELMLAAVLSLANIGVCRGIWLPPENPVRLRLFRYEGTCLLYWPTIPQAAWCTFICISTTKGITL
ncbi:hypothetical protein [Bifidobacterium callitrichidarum]|uniref:Uncharacterized protein n=1 Tax=Bifidobacterium callitrichidarum TaxID=2052941 RepID=A0A2U2N931_9BIFI|nr:hypothetical protein [Bifidobacterium callitrichidarum]PWG65607.1 hypothetical protein DF196_06650 [Bifidobacterium callitrichidarum]